MAQLGPVETVLGVISSPIDPLTTHTLRGAKGVSVGVKIPLLSAVAPPKRPSKASTVVRLSDAAAPLQDAQSASAVAVER
uniref:Uncharacterized protein n=1 Tax=Arcella intermedia TaxID=1963864 RepID=A0A6B2LMP8_9EUKA